MLFTRKYKFWGWVCNYPYAERTAILNRMAEAAGVKRRVVTRWMDIPLGSKSALAYDAVVAMCKVLEKDPATALNTAPVLASVSTPTLAE